MKRTLIAMMAMCAVVASGQTMKEWQDPEVNAVNRMPMHTTFEIADAQRVTLDGNWKFKGVNNSYDRPTDFFKTTYNDKAWGEMPVPGMWELNGFGDPQYLNVGYPWRSQYKSNPPEFPEKDNRVGSYRRTVNVPKEFIGKEIVLHLGCASSCAYLWVNGKFVGYTEDSHVESDFDVTKYIKAGENLIAMQIFRWCDGTYLEDQDLFRFGGVLRTSYLQARDKKHIEDLRVNATLDDKYENGIIDIALTNRGGKKAKVTLMEGDKAVAEMEDVSTGVHFELKNVRQWNAEDPYLYKVVVEAYGEKLSTNVGFRRVEIKNSQLLVNGQAILIKGADRHEIDPDYGFCVPYERMLSDAKLMKKMNINGVRTSHYPDAPQWYDICDELGIYVVAEANVESHGMGYGESSLAKNPLYAKAHMERNQRNVQCHFNHPSVIIWSMGNEAGFGPNFEAVYKWIKAEDTTRPVQYERAENNDFTDIFCPMYMGYEDCERYCTNNPAKPLIQCEYAHAMGNSMGGFKEYWDLIRKLPNYQGGFIWDFVDQGLRMKTKEGKEYYCYGGDFNNYDASDNNFCDNGLVSPDRKLNPHAYEVVYYYQNIWTTPVDLNEGKVEIYNERFFTDLKDCYMEWTLQADGKRVATGRVDDINVAPQQKKTFALGYDKKDVEDAEGEVLLTVAYKLKKSTNALEAGETVARQQLEIRTSEPKIVDKPVCAKFGQIVKEQKGNIVKLSNEYFSLEIDAAKGLKNYVVNGKKIFYENAALRPNFWRAPTDNDMGAVLQRKLRAWLDVKTEVAGMEVEVGDKANVELNYNLKGANGDDMGHLSIKYEITRDGRVKVSESLKADGKAPHLMRFGMRVELGKEYEMARYYGRGPVENYVDRKDNAFVGEYTMTASELFYPYLRPQENGARSDIRWWRQTNKAGRGIEITANGKFTATALRHSQEQLDEGLDKHQRHSELLEEEPFVSFEIDGELMGLGCVNSWYSWPRTEYQVPYKDYTFEFEIAPVK